MAQRKLTKGEVVNRNRKVSGDTTMQGKKLKKALARIEELTQQSQQASMGLLNMRQMYEGAVQEKQQMTAQINNLQTMLTALVIQGRGKKVTIKAASFAKVSEVAGLDTKLNDNEDLIISSLTHEDVEAMQDDLEEDEVEAEAV